MKFFKENKVIVIFLGIILIFIAVCLFILFKYLLLSSDDLYGNRLEGIEEYKIDNDKLENIKNSLIEENLAQNVNYDIKGRILSFTVTVNPETSVDSAKSIPGRIISNFDESYTSYYDFQVFITIDNLEQESIYPIIAYKHKTSPDFIWTNNI